MADVICGEGWTSCHATLAYAVLGGFVLLATLCGLVALGKR